MIWDQIDLDKITSNLRRGDEIEFIDIQYEMKSNNIIWDIIKSDKATKDQIGLDQSQLLFWWSKEIRWHQMRLYEKRCDNMVWDGSGGYKVK